MFCLFHWPKNENMASKKPLMFNGIWSIILLFPFLLLFCVLSEIRKRAINHSTLWHLELRWELRQASKSPVQASSTSNIISTKKRKLIGQMVVALEWVPLSGLQDWICPLIDRWICCTYFWVWSWVGCGGGGVGHATNLCQVPGATSFIPPRSPALSYG